MDTDYWLLKALIAIPGGVVAWRSYRAFKRRQRDPNALRDPTTDRWWRIATYSAGAVLADLLAIVVASVAGASRSVGLVLFAILAPAVLVVFIAAFVLGWRGALS